MSASISSLPTVLNVSLISPDEVFSLTNIKMVTVITTEGEMGIMPGHISMMVSLVESIITIIDFSGKTSQYNISSGFADIQAEKVIILTDLLSEIKLG